MKDQLCVMAFKPHCAFLCNSFVKASVVSDFYPLCTYTLIYVLFH